MGVQGHSGEGKIYVYNKRFSSLCGLNYFLIVIIKIKMTENF
jgi:hypothetical protein